MFEQNFVKENATQEDPAWIYVCAWHMLRTHVQVSALYTYR